MATSADRVGILGAGQRTLNTGSGGVGTSAADHRNADAHATTTNDGDPSGPWRGAGDQHNSTRWPFSPR